MASGISSANSSVVTYLLGRNTFFIAKPISKAIIPRSSLSLGTQKRKQKSLSMCFVTGDKNEDATKVEKKTFVQAQNEIKFFSRAEERQTYLVAAIASSLGISSMAVLAVHYRFSWLTEALIHLY